jgi:hypothetical protein
LAGLLILTTAVLGDYNVAVDETNVTAMVYTPPAGWICASPDQKINGSHSFLNIEDDKIDMNSTTASRLQV